MKYDIIIQKAIDKGSVTPIKKPKAGPATWRFEQKNIRMLMDLSASEDYSNNRKVLMSVKEYLHNSKFENKTVEKLSDYFNKFIEFNEKRLQKLSK